MVCAQCMRLSGVAPPAVGLPPASTAAVGLPPASRAAVETHPVSTAAGTHTPAPGLPNAATQPPASPVGHHPAGESPAVAKRLRFTKKQPVVRPGLNAQPQVQRLPTMEHAVHHVWLQDGTFRPPRLWKSCLGTCQPAPQVIWVWTEQVQAVVTAVSEFPNVQVMSASCLVQPSRVRWMMRHNVPVQWIKDIAEMAVLMACGGWFCDLDVLSLALVEGWPSCEGYAFACHPKRNDRFACKYVELSLGLMRMPANSALATSLHTSFLGHAYNHAKRVSDSSMAPVEWNSLSHTSVADRQAWRKWTANMRKLSDLVTNNPYLHAAIFPSEVFVPYAQWLRSWPPTKSGGGALPDNGHGMEGDEAEVGEPPAAVCASSSRSRISRGGASSSSREPCLGVDSVEIRGCNILSLATAEVTSFAINLWGRQWPTGMQDAAAVWAMMVRDRRRGDPLARLNEALRALADLLRRDLTEGECHIVLGGALQVASSPEASAKLRDRLGRPVAREDACGHFTTRSVAAALMLNSMSITWRGVSWVTLDDKGAPVGLFDFSTQPDGVVPSREHNARPLALAMFGL